MDKPNKEILQAFTDWFMREYSNFGGKPIAERYEEAFDTSNNDFIDARYDAFQDGWKAQQAKVEEQAQEIANLKSLIQGHELRHQQNLSIKQKLTRRSEELQKRVDKAIRLLVEAELYQSEPNIDLAVKALKGEG